MDELSYVVKKLIDYAFTEEIYNKIIQNYCNVKQEYVPILFVYSIFATLLLFFICIFSYLRDTKISKSYNISITTFDGDKNSSSRDIVDTFSSTNKTPVSEPFQTSTKLQSTITTNDDDDKIESPIIFSNNTSPLITIFQATTIKKLLSTISTNDENSDENGDDNNESPTTSPNNNNNIGPFSTIFQTTATTTKSQPTINNISGNNSDENYVDDKNLLLNNFNNSINNTNINAIEKIEILRLRNAILTKVNNQLGAWFLKYLDRINFKYYFMNVKKDLEFIIHYRNLLTNQKVSISNYMEYMRKICRTEYCFAKTQEYGYLTFEKCKELG